MNWVSYCESYYQEQSSKASFWVFVFVFLCAVYIITLFSMHSSISTSLDWTVWVYVFVVDRQHEDTTYNWVQGLGSAPDEPHAVNASSRKTEGNGVGVTKEPPVSVRVSESGTGWVHGVGAGRAGSRVVNGGGSDAAFSLCFNIRVIGQEVTWETLLIGRTLFVEIPSDILPDGSKER